MRNQKNQLADLDHYVSYQSVQVLLHACVGYNRRGIHTAQSSDGHEIACLTVQTHLTRRAHSIDQFEGKKQICILDNRETKRRTNDLSAVSSEKY